MAGQQLRDLLGLPQGAHKGHHDLHIGQAHLASYPPKGFALHGESLAEVCADVARSTPKTQHRVFFFRLVAAAANQLAVFVALEVRQSHDDRLGPEGRGDAGHAFGDLVNVKSAGGCVATGYRLHCFF